MRKKISFISAIFIFLVANVIYSASYKEPKVLWEKKPDSGFSLFPIDQDQSADYFKALEMKTAFSAKDTNIIKFDSEGNSRTEEYRFDDKNNSKKYTFGGYKLYLFSNKYYIKEYTTKFEFYDSSNKLIFSDKIGINNIENCFITNKNQLLVDFFKTGKKNTIIAYSMDNGSVLYQIDYSLGSSDNHRAKIYFEEGRIVIYENSRDLSIYSISDGSLVNKIQNFAKDADIFDFYKYDNDIFFLSIQSHYICFLSLESGRLISSIKYRDKSTLSNLNQIDIKKKNGFYYLLLNSRSSKDTSVICIDSNATKPVWEKYLKTTDYIDYFESGKNIILHDDDSVYCIESNTGTEIWKSGKLKSINRVNLIDKLFIVNSNFKDDYYAFDTANGNTVWSLKLTDGYVSLDNIDDKFFVISDTKNIYKIEIETGKILWKVDSYKNVEYTGYLKDEKSVVVYFNKKRGIAEIGFDTGREKWVVNTKYDLVDTVVNGDKLYIADRKTIYGVNVNTGETFLKNDVKFAGEINSLQYLKNKNQFVFFDKVKDIYFYDIDSNVISKKVRLQSFDAKYIELKLIGDYLFITEINLAKSGYTIIPGITYFTSVSLKNYDVLYSLVIGKHEFGNLGDFERYYYDKYGTYYSSEGLGKIYQNQVIFYPRREFFSKNVMIMQQASNISFSDILDPKIIAYEIFPNNAVPSENEIKNMEKHFIGF
jgi:hypothetical protein